MTTTITYPAQLPKPSARYTFTKKDGAITTKFQSGKTRRRNAYNDLRREVSLQWEFSQLELDFFQGWYSYTLNNGAENFLTDLLLDGVGYQNYEVTPIGDIKATHSGVGYFKVSLKVLCLAQKYLPAEAIELFQHYSDTPEEMLATGDPLNQFINVSLPTNFQLLENQ